jgi:hypothetical protein
MSKVVKIDVTRPFCVKRQVGVRFEVFINSVRMDARKKLLIFVLPLLQLVIKNGFRSLILW